MTIKIIILTKICISWSEAPRWLRKYHMWLMGSSSYPRQFKHTVTYANRKLSVNQYGPIFYYKRTKKTTIWSKPGPFNPIFSQSTGPAVELGRPDPFGPPVIRVLFTVGLTCLRPTLRTHPAAAKLCGSILANGSLSRSRWPAGWRRRRRSRMDCTSPL